MSTEYSNNLKWEKVSSDNQILVYAKDKGVYGCQECRKVFDTKQKVASHLSRTHGLAIDGQLNSQPESPKSVSDYPSPSNIRIDNKDPDKALVFKLFRKGRSPTEALIESGFSFDFIKESYEQFLEFGQNRLVPKSFVKKLLNLSRWVSPQCNEYEEIEQIVEDAIRSHLELKKHFYLCKVCRKTIPIRDEALEDAQVHLSQKWGHTECIDSV